MNYQFRVVSVNAVGRSQPSKPSLRYATPPAGKHCHLVFFYVNIFNALPGIALPSSPSEGHKDVRLLVLLFLLNGHGRR